jgi:hypothetical protein
MKAIYVESLIRGPLERLWRLTQEPGLHQRWDLRFTSIEYLPRPDASQPQQFLYSTRIGFGLKVRGRGESVGSSAGSDGGRTSALRFWSDDGKSLIRKGSGYWKYVPTRDGVRFLTLYDYEVRGGSLGRLFDRAVFRRLIGWATAWSFDRLRLWIEREIDPAVSMRGALIHAIARLTLGFVWIYHGLVPKLLLHHADEILLLRSAGVRPEATLMVLRALGCLEVVFGLTLLLLWRRRWPFLTTIVAMIVAGLGVALTSPASLGAAFNPVTLNTLVVALAAVGYLSSADLPSARRCLRRKPDPAS